MRLEHVAFNVKVVNALTSWYVSNLDMTVVRAFDDPPYIHFLADESGHSLIEVYSNGEAEYPEYGAYHPATFHLAFAVDDIASVSERLVAAGAAMDGGIDINVVGDRLAFLRDPWGHTIQLVQRTTAMLD